MIRSPLVSIIIVNYNGKKYLKECLTSLFNQTYKYFEIIVVDNKSSDDSVEFVRSSFGDSILVIQNDTNLGFAAGCNIGIKASKGSLICLFNQDVVADKEWLSILVSVIQSSEDIAAVTGKLYYWGDKYGKDTVFCTWSKVDPYTAGAYNFYKGDEPISKVDYLTGAAMLVKKEVIDKIGLLDTEYFLYFDETEWCARMIRASYDLVYVPQAIAWHVVSSSLTDSNLKLYYMKRSRMRFALKNFDVSYLPIYFAFFSVESIYDLLTAIQHRNFFSVAKINARVLVWNIIHLHHTISLRRVYNKLLKNSGRRLQSYNKSLPLKMYKIGRLEQYLKIFDK
jgi:GT2 family glycosyltransferase